MTSGENIHNAFDVVAQTYENVNKLMDYCREAADEKGEFVSMTPKFLRYKSDVSIYGWYISSFILLFQSVDDDPLENGWHDGPVYVLEINLYDPEVFDVPTVNIARYEYDDMSSWPEGCSPANHGVFYKPLYYGHIQFEQEGTEYTGRFTDTDEADRRFLGLRRISGMEIPLTDITSSNAYDTIFGGFMKLNELYPVEKSAPVRAVKIKPLRRIKPTRNKEN